MMNHKSSWISFGLAAVTLTACAMVVGCSGEDDQQVAVAPAPPPPPPPPPAPELTPIEQLMDELNIDRRVSLPEDRAPDNDVDRKAVLVFFDSIARGNAQSLKGMLPLSDQLELNALVDSGAWKSTVSRIQKIAVQTGSNAAGLKCALAVVEVGSGPSAGFQPQLWYFQTENDQPVFEAAPTPPGIMDKLSGSDWIAAWHQILEAEMALASKPDEEVNLSQQNLDTATDSGSSSGGGVGTTPGGGGGGRKLRDPTGPKIPAGR